MTALEARPGPDAGAVARAVRLVVSPLALADPASTCERLCRWVICQPDRECALGVLLGLNATELRELAGPEPVAIPAPSDPPARPPDRRPDILQVVGGGFTPRPITDAPGLTAADRRQVRVAAWIRNGGIVVLLFLAFQWWGTNFQQRRTQARFHAHYQAASDWPAASPGPVLTGAAPALPPLPSGAVARLQIPAIHLDQFVVEGTGVGDLEQGPGHYLGTPLPGEAGNAAIAGHRSTYGAPFNRLNQLVAGDTIVATTDAGPFLYVVSGKETIKPNDSSVLASFGDNRLTLTTCTPEFFATKRLVVIARLQGPVATTVSSKVAAPAPLSTQALVQSAAVSATLRAQAQTGFVWSALLPVLVGLALVVGLGLLWRPARRYLPPVAAVAVLAPLWSGALLFLFEQLTHFLPPSV